MYKIRSKRVNRRRIIVEHPVVSATEGMFQSPALSAGTPAVRFYTEVSRLDYPSIQFNSIQFRHLYAPANEHHVGAHGEEKTKENNKVHE